MVPPAESTPVKSKPGEPLVPFGWNLMQAALFFSGLLGVVAGMAQSSWWSDTPIKRPPGSDQETRDWVAAEDTLRSDWKTPLKSTNLAQLTLSAALVIGGTLMSARFASLRLSILAVGWLGIIYAVVGSSIYVWYLARWASWAAEMPANADPAGLFNLPTSGSGWALAVAIGVLGLGKLLFFVIVVGYFGRFDVRAYLEDPPAWFFASSDRPSVAP